MKDYTDPKKEARVQETLSECRGLHLDNESIDNVKRYFRYISYRTMFPEFAIDFRIHGEKKLADQFVELLKKYTHLGISGTQPLSISEKELLHRSSDENSMWKDRKSMLMN